MSLESYAIHIAPRGGKIDLIIDQIQQARENASDARWAYARSKGATGLYQNESSVSGLIFKEGKPLPEGWVKSSSCQDGIVASPKAKDRTKEARLLTKTLKAELAALPSLPGSFAFTKAIGTSEIIGSSQGRGFCLLSCWYERVGETTFVGTPWSTKQEETGSLDDDNKTKTAFLPEGCERVGLSVYYAAKEKVEPVTV